jgi:hypothetical protein
VEPATTSSNATRPQIALDDAGNVLAIWLDVGNVRAARFVIGQGWETAVTISQGGSSVQSLRLSGSQSGVGMASWEDQDKNLWFSRFE